MRRTLTLDDDVAAMLRRVRESRYASLKDVVNEALRRGLAQMESRPSRRLIGNLDDVAEALAIAEGENFK
jgi:Arc/MetJ-type ribon-helix-helix transcriptional regulator